MKDNINRKIDRRTKYTKSVIKESLIDLMREKSFSKITVKELCAKAEINRGTLYIHYADLYDVLDEVENDILDEIRDDLIQMSTYDESRSLKTQDFFNSATDQSLYRLLMKKQGGYTRIIEKTIQIIKGNFVPVIMQNFGLDEKEAEWLCIFLFNGSVAVNCQLGNDKYSGWTKGQAIIDRFIEGGYNSLYASNKAKEK